MPDPIAEPVINSKDGLKSAWKQPGGYGRNDSGYFQTEIYEGPRDQVMALAGQFDTAGVTWEVQHRHGRVSRLTAQISSVPGGGNEIIEDVWELDPSETQKELLEADFPNPGTLASLSATDRTIVKKNVEDTTFNAVLPDAFDNCDNPTTARSFYLLMKAGVTNFPVEATSIRRTRTVSNVSTAFASFTNVGRILSNSSMNTMEGSGTLFLFALPTIPSATQFIETAGDLQYGWRKMRPRITRLSRIRWQIVNVYQFGLWAVKMWGAVI